ncbi:MAG TPA: hypothetical protein VGK90_07735 [Rhizomicrobium sp.]
MKLFAGLRRPPSARAWAAAGNAIHSVNGTSVNAKISGCYSACKPWVGDHKTPIRRVTYSG